MPTTLPQPLLDQLRQHFSTRFTQGESNCLQHGRDESVHEPLPPLAVVFAESTEEVALVVTLCAEYKVPMIPYGVGSSVEGHVLAPHGGISIDLSGMKRIIAIHTEDGDATVQAGVTRLLVGSEGTLGIMTELTVKLHPIPEAISAAVCTFPSIEAAVQTVIQTIQLGVPVARIELLDALSLAAINKFSKTTLAEAPTLFFDFHGSPAAVAEHAETVQAIADEMGGANFEWATRPEDRSRLWQARHDAYFACLQLKPGCRCFPTDVCVPISRLAECIAATYDDIAQVSIPIALFGHVGDGNFHLVVLVDRDNPQEMAEAAWISERVVERAIALDGTCTGEHGIGLGKRKYLVREHGAVAVDVMRALKIALDPHNLLNPGKVLP